MICFWVFCVQKKCCCEGSFMLKFKKIEFCFDDFVVYLIYGVGWIVLIEEQEIVGLCLEMFVILFEKDKMILCVFIVCVLEIGMCGLLSFDLVDCVFEMLKGKVCVKCVMWLCCVQEYE